MRINNAVCFILTVVFIGGVFSLFAESSKGEAKTGRVVPKVEAREISKQAKKQLKATLAEVINARRTQPERGVSQKEIDSLTIFLHTHSRARSSLRAKFLIGNAYLNDGKPSEVPNGVPYFEDIVANHPSTPEAALAKVQLLLLKLRNAKDTELRARYIQTLKKAMREALSQTELLDKDTDELARLFKERTLGKADDMFTPRLRLDISALAEQEGNLSEAKSVLRQIMQDYPDSLWSSKAERRLKTIELQE